MTEKNRIIIPGEFIATEEEYVSGENTYAKEGKILATAVGVAEYDDANKEARIIGKKVDEIRAGDIVIGKVMLVKESTAVITLLKAENGKRITGQTIAQLAVRNVANEYIHELKKTVKIGDIIRAQIVGYSELGVDLSTKGKGLGIIKAYCSNCRSEMQFSAGKLMCISCGNVEDRKWFEKEDEYQPRAPREGGYGRGFERREGGRDRGFGGGGFRGRSGPRREGGFGGGFGGRDNRNRGFGGRRDGQRSFGGRDRR